MQLIRNKVFLSVVMLTCVALAGGCSWFGGDAKSPQPDKQKKTATPGSTYVASGDIHNVEVDLLNNIKTYGFNNDPSINDGLGGLYINWRYGTKPLQTNINGTGETDDNSGQALRHDNLTDLRYLHNLWLYRVQNPGDHQFDSEIDRFTKIVQKEFKGSHNERGWLYDEFIDLYKLSHDTFYQETAQSLAGSYAKTFDAVVGSIYKTSSHQQGSYRVDLTLEAGCALIQAGTQFNHPDWIEDGQNTVKFLYAHAYIAQYHAFPAQMDNVFNTDKTVNAFEPFYSGHTKNYAVNGNQMQLGGVSQMVVSLLDTYQITNNQDFLQKATDLLDPLTSNNNSLKLWDTSHGGYYFGIRFEGSSPTQPGSISILNNRKEAGRQAIMLQAFHMANKVTNNKYKDMEDQMRAVALQHIYVPEVHGALYLVNADWTTQKFKNGTMNDMVTTEAIGALLESLFAVDR